VMTTVTLWKLLLAFG